MLTTPAMIVAGIQAILLVLILIALSMKVSVSTGLIVFFAMLPISIIWVYDIDCVFVGSCTFWGWVKTILTSCYCAVAVVLIISTMAKGTPAKATPAADKKLPPPPLKK